MKILPTCSRYRRGAERVLVALSKNLPLTRNQVQVDNDILQGVKSSRPDRLDSRFYKKAHATNDQTKVNDVCRRDIESLNQQNIRDKTTASVVLGSTMSLPLDKIADYKGLSIDDSSI